MNLSDNWKKDYPSAKDITEEGLDEMHAKNVALGRGK